MQTIKKGSTDVSLDIQLFDATNGSPKTGLNIANLQIRYIRVEDDNDISISAWQSLTALSSLTDAHTDNSGYEIGEGHYRIDVPDGAFAAGAGFVCILVQDSVDNSVMVESKEIQLTVSEIVLTNKAVQDKTTGKIDYYADDGQTIILTHTPTDAESAVTRTPS